ncbi:MAG: BatD family protein [Bdellovibrionota bacterium]
MTGKFSLLRFAFLVVAGGAILLVSSRGFAAPAFSVAARFDRAEAVVGELLSLTVEVTGQVARLPNADPQLPAEFLHYFEIQGASHSFQTSIVNGAATVKKTVMYQVRPIKAGQVRLGSAVMAIGDAVYKSQPLEILVREAGAAPAGRKPGGEAVPYFVEARTPVKSPVYVGEEIPVSLVIYSVAPVTNVNLSAGFPAPTRFRREVIDTHGNYTLNQVQRNGTNYYSASVLQVAFYPLASGPARIEPVTLDLQLGGTPQQLLDQFWGGMFGRLRGQSVRASTEALSFEVQPVPEAGKPHSFAGAVGKISILGTLAGGAASRQVKVGDPVPYTVEVSIRGNPDAVLAPALRLPQGFDSFDAQVSQTPLPTPEGGIEFKKTFSYLLVPRRPGTERFSPLSFSWFDPEKEKYQTWEAPAVELLVTGTAEPGAMDGAPSMKKEEPGLQLRYIKPDAQDLAAGRSSLLANPAFLAAVIFPLGVFGGCAAVARKRARSEQDAPWARRQKARKRFEASLKRAARAEGTGARAGESAQALLSLVGDLWNFEAAGLTRPALEGRLSELGVEEALRKEFLSFLARLDEARFAGAGLPEGAGLIDETRRLGGKFLQAREKP